MLLTVLFMAGSRVMADVVLLVVLDATEREARVVGHFGIRVAQLAQIGGARTDVEVAEDRVVALRGFELGNGALRVLDVTEDDAVNGADLLAGGLDRAVGDEHVARGAGLPLLGDLALLHALDAI